MIPAPRRGWCPGLARPMPTGDGLLVRLHPPGGGLTAAQMRAVATAARAGGNGLVDVTARANLQIRGVTPESHAGLLAPLMAAGLGDRRHDGGPQRLTLSGPAHAALADAVEAAGLAVPGLPAKTLVVIEGPDLGFPDTEADLRLRVGPEGLWFGLAAAAGVAWHRAAALEPALTVLLRGLAASGARRMRGLESGQRYALVAAAGLMASDPPAAGLGLVPGLHAANRVQETRGLSSPRGRGEGDAPLAGGGASAIHQDRREGEGVVPEEPHPAPPPHHRVDPSGIDAPPRSVDCKVAGALSPQAGRGDARSPSHRSTAPLGSSDPAPPRSPGTTLLAAEFPFGRCDAALLDRLAGWSERHGDRRAWLTPSRGVVLAARDADHADRLLAEAGAAGLIVSGSDPRRAVAACPGAPACGSGSVPAQADAHRLAAALAGVIGPVRVHVSGCPKGCAHPGAADLTLVGMPGGAYGVVPGGSAGDPPARVLPFEDVLERLHSAEPDEWSGRFREPA
ncbi:nitrite reductase [Methylobacterium oryzihabitans]|uniref:Nitrite reductase n=1 Tax=Methylobacterium oryzihabitans TaxID=2499852 RepID=A0A437P2W7_9HYPH|nr:nitrite reductase [Methylobacterium oryzihabitans]RVU16627.1 nitrite reductase [Methylobacterium oryzihabitans]